MPFREFLSGCAIPDCDSPAAIVPRITHGDCFLIWRNCQCRRQRGRLYRRTKRLIRCRIIQPDKPLKWWFNVNHATTQNNLAIWTRCLIAILSRELFVVLPMNLERDPPSLLCSVA